MSVADAQARIVFVLGFDLKPRPIAPLTPAAPAPASPGTWSAPPLVPRPAPARAGAAKTLPDAQARRPSIDNFCRRRRWRTLHGRPIMRFALARAPL